MPRKRVRFILIEEIRQQFGPEQAVQFVAEIPMVAAPLVEDHRRPARRRRQCRVQRHARMVQARAPVA